MAIPYPDWLPLAQKDNKSMTKATGFRADQPVVGEPIFQKLTDDLPVTWSLVWKFKPREERAFAQWIRSPKYLDNGTKWFDIRIKIGGGETQLQQVHFVTMPVQTSINGSITTWTATVIARELNNEDDQYDDLLVMLPEGWESILDRVVNQIMPRSD
ncbi:hypothetical protein [Biostraticola tofi]|uniref:Uncharacterized protein n=1 Tax=Biostraticola tofi TaxID=466109 RepID=A0A4R3Z596_9GAMM|nr:hypothetical protein EDC52_101733 [Biostraticola tofi]